MFPCWYRMSTDSIQFPSDSLHRYLMVPSCGDLLPGHLGPVRKQVLLQLLPRRTWGGRSFRQRRRLPGRATGRPAWPGIRALPALEPAGELLQGHSQFTDEESVRLVDLGPQGDLPCLHPPAGTRAVQRPPGQTPGAFPKRRTRPPRSPGAGGCRWNRAAFRPAFT